MLEKWLREERDEQHKRIDEQQQGNNHRRRKVKYFVTATAVEIANAKEQQILQIRKPKRTQSVSTAETTKPKKEQIAIDKDAESEEENKVQSSDDEHNRPKKEENKPEKENDEGMMKITAIYRTKQQLHQKIYYLTRKTKNPKMHETLDLECMRQRKKIQETTKTLLRKTIY